MSDLMAPLHATTPLAGFTASLDGISLREVPDLSVYSIAVSAGSEGRFANAMKKALKIDIPGPGSSAVAGNARLVWSALDQYLLLLPSGEDFPTLSKTAAQDIWITDQSDSFAMLEIAGSKAILALERICPIDLHPSAFAVGAATRTKMEHLGVLIVRLSPESFLLASARSSAGSFLHAVETSAHNVTDNLLAR